MRKYIGTKKIEAEPMNLGDFVQKTGRSPYGKAIENHEETEPGYHVKYEDGYESWSPKDVFEKAYRLSESDVDRLKIELDDEIGKIDETEFYFHSHSAPFGKLPYIQRVLLLAQQFTQKETCKLLDRRYALATRSSIKRSDYDFGTALKLLKAGAAIRRRGWNNKELFVIKQNSAFITKDIVPKMQSLPEKAKILILHNKGYIHYCNQCLIYNVDTGTADSWVPSISDVFAEDWQVVTK